LQAFSLTPRLRCGAAFVFIVYQVNNVNDVDIAVAVDITGKDRIRRRAILIFIIDKKDNIKNINFIITIGIAQCGVSAKIGHG